MHFSHNRSISQLHTGKMSSLLLTLQINNLKCCQMNLEFTIPSMFPVWATAKGWVTYINLTNSLLHCMTAARDKCKNEEYFCPVHKSSRTCRLETGTTCICWSAWPLCVATCIVCAPCGTACTIICCPPLCSIWPAWFTCNTWKIHDTVTTCRQLCLRLVNELLWCKESEQGVHAYLKVTF